MRQKLNGLLSQPIPGDAQSLAQEISGLISRHGKEAVAAETVRQTKPKRGPKAKPDWVAFSPTMFEDAQDLLKGRDPFTLRTNYKLARKLAKETPGHNFGSTVARLEKKLRVHRRWAALSTAWILTFRGDVSHKVELSILTELTKCGPAGTVGLLQASELVVANYRERFGEPPAEWSVKKIHSELTASGSSIGVLGAALLSAIQSE